jgi:hypothetical protein
MTGGQGCHAQEVGGFVMVDADSSMTDAGIQQIRQKQQ